MRIDLDNQQAAILLRALQEYQEVNEASLHHFDISNNKRDIQDYTLLIIECVEVDELKKLILKTVRDNPDKPCL